METSERIQADWRQIGKRAARGGEVFILGAAIGSGMTAQVAERGGADLLLALNAGRFRAMGAASPAATLPIRDSNSFVADFARTEILPHATLPVLFGVCAFDPRVEIERFVEQLARWGFAGLTNFPSVIHLDAGRQTALEEAGLGYDREIAILLAAQAHGLLALGYTRTVSEARRMAGAGVAAICMNFNLNARHGSEAGGIGIAEVATRSREIARAVRAINRNAICMLGGGPVTTPEELLEACREAGTQGFVGGSTMDRLPLEHSVMEVMAGFRMFHVLRRHVDMLERQLQQTGVVHGLIGHSTSMNRAIEIARIHARSGAPVLVTGEAGTGKRTAAALVHAFGERKYRPPVALSCREPQIGRLLFGRDGGTGEKSRLSALEAAAGTTLILLHLEALPAGERENLADYLETGSARRSDSVTRVRSDARIVATASAGVATLQAEGRMNERLARAFAGVQLELPPLRDRLEDLPLLVRHFLSAASTSQKPPLELENVAYRLMMNHHWPGNVRELKQLIERIAMAAPQGGRIPSEHVSAALSKLRTPRSEPTLSEREWIIDALKRNKLHRGKTAEYLGISRKTLYNRIQRHRIFG